MTVLRTSLHSLGRRYSTALSQACYCPLPEGVRPLRRHACLCSRTVSCFQIYITNRNRPIVTFVLARRPVGFVRSLSRLGFVVAIFWSSGPGRIGHQIKRRLRIGAEPGQDDRIAFKLTDA